MIVFHRACGHTMLETLFSEKNTNANIQRPLPFQLDEEPAIQLADQYNHVHSWRFLSHHVRRYPLDVRAHTRRILLAIQPELQQWLAGSLLDLFLALKGAGHPLRQRLLDNVATELPLASRQRFQQWLDEEDTSDMPYVHYAGSVLSTGENQAAHNLVSLERATHAPTNYASVMDEVQANLEYGQVDLAASLLETEMLNGRGDAQIENELLTIYRSTRHADKLTNFIAALNAQGIQASEQWRQLAQEAKHW